MEINERILELRKFLELTQSRFAMILGVTQNVVSLIETGKIIPTQKQLKTLISKLHVNEQWITEGNGEMFTLHHFPKSYFTAEQLDRLISIQKNSTTPAPISKGVPFYDIPINGASIIRLNYDTITPKYNIDYTPFNECSFYRPIYGESMSPKFKNGDIVACRAISGQDYVMYGESYLCSFKRGNDVFELLRIIRQNDNKNLLSLVAMNPNYDTIVIPKSSIQTLHIIIGKIERFV